MAGVGQVRLQALNGAKALNGGLAAEAEEGDHGQAAVLQLLQPRLVAAHVEGVKGREGAQARLASLLVSLDAEALQHGKGGDLDGNERLQVEGGLHLGARLPPVAQANLRGGGKQGGG